MSDQQAVEDLVRAASTVLPNVDVTISIRDDNGVFLYVNDSWLRDFNISPLGKTLAESGLVSVEETNRSNMLDKQTKQRRNIVEISTYKIKKQNVRMVVIRSYLRFHGEYYLATVTWILGERYSIDSPYGWSSDRADKAYAEMIAERLQLLDEQTVTSLSKASIALQSMLKSVQDAIAREGK